MRPHPWTIFLVFLGCAVSTAWPENVGHVVRHYPQGIVDWTARTITVVGSGFPNPHLSSSSRRKSALNAAKADSRRNLVHLLHTLTRDNGTSLRSGAQIRSWVQHSSGDMEMLETNEKPNQSLEVKFRVAMADLAAVLAPTGFGRGSSATLFRTLAARSTRSLERDAASDTVYTGLVVDARGLGLEPSASPRIFGEDGQAIYFLRRVDRVRMREVGMVGYASAWPNSSQSERIGDTPLIVRAIAPPASSDARDVHDVVLSEDDIILINFAKGLPTVLRACRVVFIID